MATKNQDEPPTYSQISESSRHIPGQSRSLVVALFQNKPGDRFLDLRFDLPWNDNTVMRWMHEVILLPTEFTLELLDAHVRERIEQRFRLQTNYDNLQVYFRVKLESDTGSDQARRILIHEGNFEAVKPLLERPDATLTVWFGEISASAGKKIQYIVTPRNPQTASGN